VFKIGWFSTGRDQAARDLLTTVWRSIKKGEIAAEIPFVFSNREPGESVESDLFFELVRSYGILPIHRSPERFRAEFERARRYVRARSHQIPPSKGLQATLRQPWRREYDRWIMANIEGSHPDLCVLAGYMLIVGEEMCQRYPMVNLHPAAPGGPAGTWQEVIWKLIENRAEETGVMMHLVTPELDKGPAVTYCSFPIRGKPFDRYWHQIKGLSVAEIKAREGENNPLFRIIRRHGLAREFPLIVATIKAFSQGRVRIEEGKVVSASGEVIRGYNLTEEIESELHLL
jgi:folate-dependent phosphoribosylglycinamide formyltransferase PurN